MDASKVTVSPETLRFKKMSPGKRSELRRKNIIELIESKPFGTPITLAEFAAVCSFTDASAHAMLTTMVKKGIISKNPISKAKIAYSVNGEPRVIKPKTEVEPTPTRQIDMDVVGHEKTLGDYAKDFAWQHNSDSLREFVKYMDSVELDIRRLISGGGGY
jgi:hypothetical protein